MPEGRASDELDVMDIELPPLDVAPGEVAPATGKPTLSLTADEKDELARLLINMLDSHDAAMAPRLKRLREIEDAYNLVPDSDRQGYRPDAANLVSEFLRSATNVATAQINEALIGTKDGLIMVAVADDQNAAPETVQAVEIAERIEAFLKSYGESELNLQKELYSTIHGMCKLGNARVRLMWEVENISYGYRKRNGQLGHVKDRKGAVKWTFVPLRLAVSWPLNEPNLEKCIFVGHRTFMEHFQFKALCRKLGIADELVAEYLSEADERDEGLEDEQKGRDIQQPRDNAMDGQICVTELWCNMPLPGDDEPTKFYGFLLEEKQRLIWADYNPLLYQRMGGYFDFCYWRELESIFGSGVGHESMYPQAADSAMWNMYIDNLKVIGNYLMVLRAGTTAEALMDEISPGYQLVTEDPEKDFRAEQLGGDLSEMHEGFDRNETRQMKSTGITGPTQGMADPILKSGASPGSYMQLIAQSNKKFKQVDINFRADLAPVFMFQLELFQQFAPDGVYYQHVAEDTATVLSQLRFTPPRGDLSKTYRIKVRPPSAASNREGLRMNVMLIFNLLMQSLPSVLGLADQVYGKTDPALSHRLQEQALLFIIELFEEILDVHEVPGLTAKMPKVEKIPQDVLTNQLFARLGEYEAMIQQLIGAASAAPNGGGAGQLEGPARQQGLPGSVPV